MHTSVNKQIVEQLQALQKANELKALDCYLERKQQEVLQSRFDEKGNVIRDLRKEYELYDEADTLRILPNLDRDVFTSFQNYRHFTQSTTKAPNVDRVPLAPIPVYKFKPKKTSLLQTVMSLFV